MERSNILLLFLSVLVWGGYATYSASPYWQMMLPNTPVPAAVKDLLSQPGLAIHPEVMSSGVDVDTNLQDRKVKYDDDGPAPHPVPDQDLFFTEDAILIPSNKKFFVMNFSRGFPIVPLLSRADASNLPFSTAKLPTLLSHFNFHPGSVEARSLNLTLDACERKDRTETVKLCATSLESMVDFITSALRTHDVLALSTESPVGLNRKQKYVVTSSPKLVAENAVVCHPVPYPYAVFYCHLVYDTRAYVVPLTGEDGTKIVAATVCHTDTSLWAPKYMAFRMLNLKPGKSTSICHFLGLGGILWAPRA